jgi:hypothetical protein
MPRSTPISGDGSAVAIPLAPVVTVVGYERLGHQHIEDTVQRL